MNTKGIIGLGGLPPGSSHAAERVEKALSGPMVILAFAIIPLVFIELSLPPEDAWRNWLFIGDALIWGAFVAEHLIMCFVTRKPWEYSKRNWMNVLIILVSLPSIMPPAYATIRALRMLAGLRILRVLAAGGFVYRSMSSVMTRHGFAYFVGLAVLVMLAGATILPIIDSNVESPIDALWWSLVTVTTVGGFNDPIPSNGLSRLVGAVVIILGVSLTAILTANISAYFVEKDTQDEFSGMMKTLESIDKRLERLEKKR